MFTVPTGAPEPGRSTTSPIRRLRVVPNPSAVADPPRTGGRHRKADPDDEFGNAPDELEDATTDVVPAQRAAALTVPPPVA